VIKSDSDSETNVAVGGGSGCAGGDNGNGEETESNGADCEHDDANLGVSGTGDIIIQGKATAQARYSYKKCDTGTHCSVSTAPFRSPTLVSLLSLLQVFRILASGFTSSVYPRLRVFHETPTMQVANSQHATTAAHSSRCPRERQSSVAAYLERQGSVVAFFLVAFNSSGITIVAHILEVVSKCEELMRSIQKMPKFSNGRRMVRADGDHL